MNPYGQPSYYAESEQRVCSPRFLVTVLVQGDTYTYSCTGLLDVNEATVRVGDTYFVASSVLKIERKG